jgi:hypothetical protein
MRRTILTTMLLLTACSRTEEPPALAVPTEQAGTPFEAVAVDMTPGPYIRYIWPGGYGVVLGRDQWQAIWSEAGRQPPDFDFGASALVYVRIKPGGTNIVRTALAGETVVDFVLNAEVVEPDESRPHEYVHFLIPKPTKSGQVRIRAGQ